MSGPRVYEHDKGGFINLDVGGGSYNTKHQTSDMVMGEEDWPVIDGWEDI